MAVSLRILQVSTNHWMTLSEAPEAPGTPPRERDQTEIQPATPPTDSESCFQLDYDVICPVCFDAYQTDLCHASLLGRKTCGHLVCEKCVADWMRQEIKDHRHFVRCPHDKCGGVFSAEQCDLVLGAKSATREKLRSLNTPEQQGLRAGTHMYCPSGCNHVLEIKKMDSVTRRTCDKLCWGILQCLPSAVARQNHLQRISAVAVAFEVGRRHRLLESRKGKVDAQVPKVPLAG